MRKLRNEELDRLNISEFRETAKTPLVIVLDNIRSLNNIGSVFRTADAFLVKKIYLCGITACPPHKDIHKTALGATESGGALGLRKLPEFQDLGDDVSGGLDGVQESVRHGGAHRGGPSRGGEWFPSAENVVLHWPRIQDFLQEELD